MSSVLLYFGSFNPPHRGHTAIIKHLIKKCVCDELWVVISPHNPLKNSDTIVTKEDRAKMVELALKEERLTSSAKVCLVEFELPTPSYTVNTLKELTKRYPEHTFSILIGGDNQCGFEKWKSWDYIMENHDIYVYPRPGSTCNIRYNKLQIIDDAPLMTINSTEIREALACGVDEHEWIHTSVMEYIRDRGLWTK